MAIIENEGAIKWNKFNLRSIILSFFDDSRMEDEHYFQIVTKFPMK